MRQHTWAGSVAAALLAVGALAPAASAKLVGPSQSFIGAVDGVETAPPIRVACPVGAVRGYPLPHQTVNAKFVSTSVTPDASPIGYTGTAHRLRASIDYTLGNLGFQVPLGTIRDYSQTLTIPTTVKVACSGVGGLVLAPVNGGPNAYPSEISVEFANIAVDPPGPS